MAEKSPSVHPMRHLSVLRPALFHVGFDDQKLNEVTAGGGAAVALLLPHPVTEALGSRWRRDVEVAKTARGLAADNRTGVAVCVHGARRNEARQVRENIFVISIHDADGERNTREQDELLVSRF